MLAEIPICPVPLPSKLCKRCGMVKPRDDFYNVNHMRDGKASECKPCYIARNVSHRRAIKAGTAKRREAIDPSSTSKICSVCKAEKPLDGFHAHKMGRHGKRAACKECQAKSNRPWQKANSDRGREYARRWREANPEKLNECQVKYLETAAGRAKALWHAARQRRPEGFSLTKEHVIRGVERGVCPISGFPFDLSARYRSRSDKSRNPYAPSLDRLDNSKGYTDENVIVVCSQVNMMRGEMSYPELAAFCRAVLEHGSVLTNDH